MSLQFPDGCECDSCKVGIGHGVLGNWPPKAGRASAEGRKMTDEVADVVEWLRDMQDEYAPGGGGVPYHERYKQAADLLERMATKNEVLTAVVEGLGQCLDKLTTPPSSSEA